MALANPQLPIPTDFEFWDDALFVDDGYEGGWAVADGDDAAVYWGRGGTDEQLFPNYMPNAKDSGYWVMAAIASYCAFLLILIPVLVVKGREWEKRQKERGEAQAEASARAEEEARGGGGHTGSAEAMPGRGTAAPHPLHAPTGLSSGGAASAGAASGDAPVYSSVDYPQGAYSPYSDVYRQEGAAGGRSWGGWGGKKPRGSPVPMEMSSAAADHLNGSLPPILGSPNTSPTKTSPNRFGRSPQRSPRRSPGEPETPGSPPPPPPPPRRGAGGPAAPRAPASSPAGRSMGVGSIHDSQLDESGFRQAGPAEASFEEALRDVGANDSLLRSLMRLGRNRTPVGGTGAGVDTTLDAARGRPLPDPNGTFGPADTTFDAARGTPLPDPNGTFLRATSGAVAADTTFDVAMGRPLPDPRNDTFLSANATPSERFNARFPSLRATVRGGRAAGSEVGSAMTTMTRLNRRVGGAFENLGDRVRFLACLCL